MVDFMFGNRDFGVRVGLGNRRYPSNSYGFAGNGYGYGAADRIRENTLRRRQQDWNPQYGYDTGVGYGRRPDPRDLDGDGRVERWEMQEHRRMQQQQLRYGHQNRLYYHEYVPAPQPYVGNDSRRPYYDAPYFRGDQAAGQMAGPRATFARDGMIMLSELGALLLNNLFNSNEVNALLRDANDGQLNDQRLLNQLFGKQVRLADDQGQSGPDVAAQAARMVQEYARVR